MDSAGSLSPKQPASEALLALLSPLPSLEELAQRASASRSRPPSPSKKRTRPREASKPPEPIPDKPAAGLPRDVAAAVDAVRRAGAPADTLFFAGLPPGLDDDSALRAAIGLPLRELKLLRHSRGKGSPKTLAWASFFNEADCVSALIALRRDAPALRPRLHTPKAGAGAGAGPGVGCTGEKKGGGGAAGVSSEEAFQARAAKITTEGGLANTIMLRSLPLVVSVEELEAVLMCFDGCCKPLRSRTSEARGGAGRNFWLTYASRDAACAAFVAMSGQHASFRCGRTQRLNPVVHNDATDAESKVRRMREAALGVHASAGEVARRQGQDLAQPEADGPGDAAMSAAASEPRTNLERLEEYLRARHGRLYFLDEGSGH